MPIDNYTKNATISDKLNYLHSKKYLPMTIIKKLVYWFKARFMQLTDEEFIALRDAYKLARPPQIEKILTTYFHCHVPRDTEVNIICKGDLFFKQLYVKSTPCGRKLSPYEQHCWVFFMPLGRLYRFPSPLDEPALTELLNYASPCKIATYIRDFALPEKFERRLLKLCREEKNKKIVLNTYHSALYDYLAFCPENHMVTPEIQKALLELGNKELLKAILKNCSFDNCILADEVIAELIKSHDEATLSLLLFKSYIANKELAQKMLEVFPQLKWQYEISKLRKPMRKLEKDAGEFFGIEAPTISESVLIIHYEEVERDHAQQKVFFRVKILPRLKSKDCSPYLCAWSTYNFPETGEKAYQSVRSTAEYLYKHFKQN